LAGVVVTRDYADKKIKRWKQEQKKYKREVEKNTAHERRQA
jgi:hypothetical protein